MREIITLNLMLGEPNTACPTFATWEEMQPALRKIVEFGLAPERIPGSGMASSDIHCPADHPGWPKMFAYLKEIGWEAVRGPVAQSQWADHFKVKTRAYFDEDDLKNAPFLRLSPGWGSDAEPSADREDVGNHLYGSREVFEYFLKDEIKKGLEAAGLGLSFSPLVWREKVLPDWWVLGTPYRMPSCLLPVHTAEEGFRCYVDEGGREPEVLSYRRSEVEQLGDFHAAWALEDIGWCYAGQGRHSLIVSHRFREVCQQLGMTEIEYYPVLLTDE